MLTWSIYAFVLTCWTGIELLRHGMDFLPYVVNGLKIQNPALAGFCLYVDRPGLEPGLF